MRSLHSTSCNLRARSGLAPLELVLSLPLLLSVMALIVNFAHVATWKVRGATNARLAMWRHRPMWNADGDPKPSNWWPSTSTQSVCPCDERIQAVDTVWNQPAIAQAWIKGPMFAVQGGYLGVRDNRVNEMSEGVSKGSAGLEMPYPFLPSMGNIDLDVNHHLLDKTWQFHNMGYGWNEARRAKGWWQLEDSPDWAQQKQLFLLADAKLVGNPQGGLMRPLDRDRDLITGGYMGMGNYQYDFYARMHVDCNNDPQAVRQNDIISDRGLVNRIQGKGQPNVSGVCEHMAQSYRRMYSDELAIRETEDPKNDARIAQLKTWIQQLDDFIGTLP